MGVTEKEGEKENGNEQGEGENVGGRIKFKGRGWLAAFKHGPKRANSK